MQAYPALLFPCIFSVPIFGVGQTVEGKIPPGHLSVALPQTLLQQRLDLGLFRWEPAIARFDWYFTPNPMSQERLYTVPLQASIPFYRDFTLHRVRSSGFWFYSYDSGAISTLFLANCKNLVSLRFYNLAIQKNSLARFSKRKVELLRALPTISTMFQIFSDASKHTFQLSLTVLVRYRTYVIFRFGGYCPPYSGLISKRPYSGIKQIPNSQFLRDFHPLQFAVPSKFKITEFGIKAFPYTTSPYCCQKGFSLTCFVFTRRY